MAKASETRTPPGTPGARPSDAYRDGSRPIDSLPTAELIQRATGQLSTLVRNELALVRMELAEKAGQAGRGAGLLGAAGVVSLYGVFGILAGIVLLLARVMPDWGAALVIGALLLAIAGLVSIAGRAQVGQATPPVPEEAFRSLRRDLDAVRVAAEDGARR
jgi:uncharacterized membrane protein YqjE